MKEINNTIKYCANNYNSLPVVISKGKGVWVWDIEGKKYLDMLSAYSAVSQGHVHPKILNAFIEQAEKITLPSRGFYNNLLGDFSKKICSLAKKDKFLPMNTGSEAVETALKVARKWGHINKKIKENSGNIIACQNNFHGRTISIISMSTEEQYRYGFGPYTDGFKIIPYDDIEALEQSINKETIAFIVEPIQGEAGIIMPKNGYLKKAYDICKKNNILFIADEIQTGFCRTGSMFACDHENVSPDILIVGKALSGGFYPVSGILANNEIMDVITPGDHGSTFGGNPLACAVGIASIDVLLDEDLAKKSKELGYYFIEKLKKIKSDNIEEIRGKGLFIGIQIKKSSGKAIDFCLKLMNEGILCKDTHHTVMRFAPPLIIKKEEIDWAFERIEKVLR